MCNNCWEELMKNFDFKSKCIETEDFLIPFIGNDKRTDLQKITPFSVKSENGHSQKVCRLCLEIANESYKLTDSENKFFQILLPEIVSLIDIAFI